MKNKLKIFVILVFLGFVIWWATFQHIVDQQGLVTQWFSGTYGVVALIGAVIGLIAAKRWGGFKTVLGKALIFFSLGLFAQEAGQLIYAYYVDAAHIQIPYPSWGDVAYFGSVLLYIVAAIYLTRISGAKFALKETKYKVIAVLVPVILLSISYTVLLRNHEYDTSHPITVFLDFGYPMGQAIYISIAMVAYLLSRKQLGGVMKSGILLVIFALVLQYVADFNFIYQSSRGTYLSGKYADLLYLISYFAMAIALIKFLSIYNGLRAKTAVSAETTEKSEEKEEKTEDDDSSEKEA
jgi:hypothetical protein